MTPILLASGSAVRAKLLKDAGVPFDVVPARVDEDAVKHALLAEHATPREIADHLAELKALRVSASHPDTLVVGADQVLVFEGKLVSKSADLDEARALLRRLSGHTHDLVSAVVCAKNGAAVWRHSAQARLQMRPLSEPFLERYLAAEGSAALDSVGCYHLERHGVQLFSAISGDYFAILGLPLLPLLAALREFGALAP